VNSHTIEFREFYYVGLDEVSHRHCRDQLYITGVTVHFGIAEKPKSFSFGLKPPIDRSDQTELYSMQQQISAKFHSDGRLSEG